MRRHLFAALLLLLGSVGARADFRFIHATDTHFGASDEPAGRSGFNARMFQEISGLDPKPALVVNSGDVVEVGTPAEYEVYRKTLAHLTLPIYNAPGNHDVRWNPLGKEGYTRGVDQPLHQSWDHENIHFVTLDSTVLLQHWGHFGQEQLDWLAEDLKKAGTQRPVIIAFHHWIGREAVQVDNQRKLLEVVGPYNVVLWLIGHGHSDIRWSIDGVPAIMAKGLYQGSYHIIDVNKDELRVRRRVLGKAEELVNQGEAKALPHSIEDVMAVSLRRQEKPRWTARAALRGEAIEARAEGELPETAKLTFRIDAGKPQAMERLDGVSWRGEAKASDLVPGEHVVLVEASLADGRAFQSVATVVLHPSHSVVPQWTAELAGAVQSRLVREGETLFVSTMRGELFALDRSTGRPKWRFAAGGPIFSSPVVVDGTVFVGSADYHVHAIDANTGEQPWKTRTGGGVFASAAVAPGDGGSIVCIASVDQKIYGLDARDGSIRWTVQGNGMYQSQAATDGRRFFVGGWDNHVRSIDAASGKEVWSRKFGRSFYYSPAISSPAVADGIVYVTSNDGVLHAMRCESGEIVWEFDGKKVGYSSPLVHAGRVYVAIGDLGATFCFDAKTGEKLWESTAPGVIYDSSFVHAGGQVYIGTVGGLFCAFDALTGKPTWQYALGPGHLLASPAADEQWVYISLMSGRVTAFPLRPR